MATANVSTGRGHEAESGGTASLNSWMVGSVAPTDVFSVASFSCSASRCCSSVLSEPSWFSCASTWSMRACNWLWNSVVRRSMKISANVFASRAAASGDPASAMIETMPLCSSGLICTLPRRSSRETPRSSRSMTASVVAGRGHDATGGVDAAAGVAEEGDTFERAGRVGERRTRMSARLVLLVGRCDEGNGSPARQDDECEDEQPAAARAGTRPPGCRAPP